MTSADMTTPASSPSPLVAFPIDHPKYVAMIEPNTAFWALVDRNQADSNQPAGNLIQTFGEHEERLRREMHALRFKLKPSGVYLNPTEQCNLNCTYCYLPSTQRQHGKAMTEATLNEALFVLREYFRTTMGEAKRKPRAIFHGAEPLTNRSSVFSAIERFSADFEFGLQTNGTLLDEEAVAFLTERNVSIGLSLDGPIAGITDATRHTWAGGSIHAQVIAAMERLRGYDSWSVIATCSTENLPYLTELVELFHSMQVPTCMLNPVRCTMPGARSVRPADNALSTAFFAALDRTNELYRETGRKLPVANFANILLAILAPTARRLMCDISPCGGGRAFFALAADGGLYPCSEFIGLPRFRGGNLLEDGVAAALASPSFRQVIERNVDSIDECKDCSIRHFCGSPCPAEAFELTANAGKGAFCDFYKEQVRYAFRLIAEGKAQEYLWDGWDKETETLIDIS